MVQQDRARATRASVIEGAANVFETVGYGNASLTDIAETAKVTKGALYFHFKSKEELAKAVIAEQHCRVRATSEAILAAGHPSLVAMVLLCRHFAEQLLVDPIVRAGIRLTLEASTFEASVKEPYEDWIATMAQLTSAGQEHGDIRANVDAAVFARYVVASFTGVQMVSEVLTGRSDLMDRVDDMWTTLLPVLSPEGADPLTLSQVLRTQAA